jgi:hypothetical protein
MQERESVEEKETVKQHFHLYQNENLAGQL